MMMDDDLENEEFDGLQSYARKGMAQELAKKLGLLGDVPGADMDDQNAEGDKAPGDAPGGDSSGDVDPELLQQILASLTKAQ